MLTQIPLLHAGLGLWAAIGTAVLALAEPPEGTEHEARKPGFTVVMRPSGLEQIVTDNYAAHPKWWLERPAPG